MESPKARSDGIRTIRIVAAEIVAAYDRGIFVVKAMTWSQRGEDSEEMCPYRA